ncbi:hypothetical protein KVV02_001708 [Mortierella alpina]|uniref:Mechanosensitive ion channel MscS domain-containing protein n=1 Tax=Mortierella alpina TaxID=64518 RepID=A0A9P7ZW18_MORAP|nr:hypothetical protein KVV02_001708 [Mortierella alpina]
MDPAVPPPTTPTSPPVSPVTAAFIILGVTVGAAISHIVLTFIFKRLAKKTIWQFDDDIVRYCQKPTFIMFPTLAVMITLQLLTLPVGVHETVKHTLLIILIFSISLLVVMLIKCGSLAVSRGSSHLKDTAPKRAREVETQIVVMTRIIQGMVWLLGLAGIAMTFPNAWQVGNALASLTIALTQPFLLEDQVEVQGEVGHIEEIQAQYVIVRTLDERRLVVPLTWFLGNIFQNWSRNSPQQIAECKVYVDYGASVPHIRQAFLKFARAHPMFDGRHCALLMTDCTSSTIELTCQISVGNAMDVIQVTSDVREAMVEVIASRQKLVPIASPGAVSRTSVDAKFLESEERPVPTVLPPLTKEDEKMGEGSKTYQSYSSVSGRHMAMNNHSALAMASSTAVNSAADHVRVNVEESASSSEETSVQEK